MNIENYVDPTTGYHTQGNEKELMDVKVYTKRVRSYAHLLKHHFDKLPQHKSVLNSEQYTKTEFWNAVSLVHDS